MARRMKGEGGITQRKDGRYMGTIETGWDAAGKRRRKTVYGRTQREVVIKLAAERKALTEHGAVVTSARTTVHTWADQWLALHETVVRSSSEATDRSAVRLWIIPVLGRKRLDAITPADIRSLTTAITTAGRSSTTAHRAHAVLMKMLRDAILEGHRVPPRILLVKGPPLAPHDRDAIPLADALLLLDVASRRPDASRWVAALLQGMRQGECLGLTWDAVDLDAGRITVNWQLDTLPYLDRDAGTFKVKPGLRVRHLEGAWHLTEVKTEHGERTIPLVPWMAAALTAWRKVAPTSPHGLIWPRADGRPRSDRDDRAEWHALQDQAGVRHASGRYYGVHEARHTCATLLMVAGVDPKIITAILGHSSIVTSRLYMHTDEATKRAALEGIAARLGLLAPQLEG